MDLTSLRYFRCIAREGSITAASRVLGVSQPTLSVAVRNLEEELHTRLLTRTRAGVELTATGRVLALRADAILAQVEDAVQQIHELQDDEVGQFTVGCQGSLGAYFLPVCQEDQLGTLLAFGFIPLLHLQALGVSISNDELADSLHLWAVAGHVLGTRVEHLPRDEAGARALLSTIQARNVAPSPEGRELTAALLKAYARILRSESANQLFLQLLRDLVGDPLCDLLAVPGVRPGRGDGRAGRGFAASLGAWERLRRVPGVDRGASALVLPALGLHARRMAGGPARFTALPPR